MAPHWGAIVCFGRGFDTFAKKLFLLRKNEDTEALIKGCREHFGGLSGWRGVCCTGAGLLRISFLSQGGSESHLRWFWATTTMTLYDLLGESFGDFGEVDILAKHDLVGPQVLLFIFRHLPTWGLLLWGSGCYIALVKAFWLIATGMQIKTTIPSHVKTTTTQLSDPALQQMSQRDPMFAQAWREGRAWANQCCSEFQSVAGCPQVWFNNSRWSQVWA